jgi:Family of unknown function (DUF6064)
LRKLRLLKVTGHYLQSRQLTTGNTKLPDKMKTPFTVGQFMEIFKAYNLAIFPLQIIFFLSAMLAVYLAIKPAQISDKTISSILSFLWLWMGIVYHLVFFTSINPAAWVFGAAFIIQGLLVAMYGVFQSKLSFRLSRDIYGFTGIILLLFALFIYPVLGYLLGHIYPASPTFGLPCPTTIYTFALFLLSNRKFPVILLIIPFAWAIIGFSAAFIFGIFEDTGLLVAALLTISMVIMKNKHYKPATQAVQIL